jgi:MoxR-like ATPase
LNLPVISRRASQMTEGDLLGLPVIQDSITHFAPPEWFQAACKDPCVLFIDELDRAPAGVRQGFFELADSRRLAGNNLHPETLIFSAINGGHNENRYDTFVLDPAEADRWTVFDLAPTVEDWVAWGRKNSKIQQGILDFIVEYPTHLEHKGEFEPGKKYPSRRSWHRFNDACTLCIC